jgi:hypothetical protein
MAEARRQCQQDGATFPVADGAFESDTFRIPDLSAWTFEIPDSDFSVVVADAHVASQPRPPEGDGRT